MGGSLEDGFGLGNDVGDWLLLFVLLLLLLFAIISVPGHRLDRQLCPASNSINKCHPRPLLFRLEDCG